MTFIYLFLYYILIYSEFQILKKFVKEMLKEYRGLNAWRSEIQASRFVCSITLVTYKSVLCTM